MNRNRLFTSSTLYLLLTLSLLLDPSAGMSAQLPELSGFLGIQTETSSVSREPSVAYNSVRDEFLVVWWDDGASADGIFAQRVKSDGTLEGSKLTIDNLDGNINWQPDVAYSPMHDQYFIVYTYESPGNSYDVWGRIVNGDGSLGAWRSINLDSHRQWNPAVAYNIAHDEFLVVYENWVDASGYTRDIEAIRIDASTWTQQSGRNIATGAGEFRTAPDVAYDPSQNSYLIAYTYQSSSSADGDILATLCSYDLSTLSSEIEVIYNTYEQNSVALAAADNEYLAVWQDGPNNGYRTIYARRVGGDGSLPTSPFLIDGVTDKIMGEPAVAYGHACGYMILWEYDTEGPTDYDLMANYVMPNSNQLEVATFPMDDTALSQHFPAVACSPGGKCLMVEEDVANFNIYGRFALRKRFINMSPVFHLLLE